MTRLFEVVAVDVDGARYCLGCAPMSAAAAESAGIGGPVFASDVDADEACDTCGEALE